MAAAGDLRCSRTFSALLRPVCVAFLLSALPAWPAPAAGPRTVCTITVNSADEQEAFRRHLAPGGYRFVELVERHRPDWLDSACRAGVACDVLVISGHYGAGNVFFADALEAREFLDIGELERVSCSGSCPGLFARLKEVYLFGCNTLNPHAQHGATGEIARSLVREGRAPVEADRLARMLDTGHGESSRDRMRLVFKDVPVIYGFSSSAPLGPTAAATLGRHFRAAGTAEVGSGHASSSLLAQFAPQGMVAARGMTDADLHADMRHDVCQFADDRLSDAQRLAFVRELLQRPMAETRMLLERIEHLAATLDGHKRQAPEVAQALDAIARDAGARARYLAFARDADRPEVRARMLNLAHALGWLSTGERRDELLAMLGELLSREAIPPTEVDLACRLNKDHGLDAAPGQDLASPGRPGGAAHAAIRACLGSTDDRVRVLKALASPADTDVRIAQVYLHHRPIADVAELRAATADVARMSASEAQVRALDVLAQHYLSDRDSLEALAQLFSQTRSAPVQNAIAGVFIRAEPGSLHSPELLRRLQEGRLKPSAGDSMVDALVRRLQLP